MNIPNLTKSFAVLALLHTAASAQENLELGKMWTFENPPLGYLQEEYGFAPTSEWFDQLRLASIRFGGGCSSSFVSPKGLIMTNHHCVRGNITAVQGDEDWLNEGFYAAALEDEVHVPGLTVQQLVSTENITDRVNAGIGDGDDADAIEQKRKANQAAILEKARQDHPGLNPEVVALFQGAIFQLYTYKVYDDIRLVCTPHLQTAHFGGDPDNFTYPRYGIDFSFCRAWEDGKPVDTSAHYFRWNTSGVLEDDLVFVTGNPGTTKRLLTVAQMEYMRDVWHPVINTMIDNRLAIRREIAEQEPTLAKEMQAQILSLENSQKALRGYYDGLLDADLMNQKRRAEQAFRARVFEDPELKAEFGDVWDEIAAATARRAKVEPRRRLQQAAHPRIAQAVALVEGKMKQAVDLAGRRVNLQQRLDFIDHVGRARAMLATEDLKWLTDMPAEELADALANSKLTDASYVESLDEEAIASADDIAIRIGRALAPLMKANSREHDEVAAIEEALGARIGQALHGAYGNKVSPDATFTLRFSDGVVKGYPFNGTIAPFRTTFFGLYARSAEFDNDYPFNLPDTWLERKDRVDMTKSVDLVSTNDIIGGNSGSPLVNKDLEVIGLVFDGNIEMLANRYVYRGDIPRSVSVHVDAIMESLKKIYDADRIVDELLSSARN